MEKKRLIIDTGIVKELMKEKEIDIKKMAELMKVTPQKIRKFFKADNHLYYSIIFAFKIAHALNVSVPTIIHKDFHGLSDKE